MSTRTKKRDRELEALVRLRDEDIDTSDIPEVTDWSGAVVGKFYRPIKEPVTLRLDVDVVAWLKSEGPGYQTRINTLLRTAMTRTPAGADTRQAGKRPSLTRGEGGRPVFAGQDLRFPSLERQGELERCCHIAELIERRGCVFAPA